jgi:RNA polymerase sigma factor (sigma-70 family)
VLLDQRSGADFFMSQSPRSNSDNSEFQTNISLIARVRDRTDVESWREFYEFYHPLLTRYLRRLGLKEDTANDVIQDVFVKLVQALPKFELDGKRGRFRSYLWKLTYNGLVDEARRLKARRQAEEEWVKRFLIADEAESRKLHQELNEINYREIVDRALPRVQAVTSTRAWTCFEQRLLLDRPGSAIAAELGISDKAVFVYASRVLKAVRQQCTAIAEELGDEPIDWLSRGT